jgi:hypothetical protein
MALSNLIGTYGDCQRLLATALKHPGLTYTAASRGEAIHLRARCNKFRALLAEENERAGMSSRTIFDDLTISLNDKCQLIFRERAEVVLPGSLTDAAGNPVELLSELDPFELDLPDAEI